jgi:hypothetical protein
MGLGPGEEANPMGKRLVGRVLGATALFVGIGSALTVAPAGASATQQVAIVSHISFNFPLPNSGDFTTSGPATDGGLICASGDVTDTRDLFVGYQSGFRYQVLLLKDFVCRDGSGTIFVKIQVHGSFDGTESFTWVVQGGTGDYANLRGSGQGSTVPNPDPSTGNTNFYEGFLVG